MYLKNNNTGVCLIIVVPKEKKNTFFIFLKSKHFSSCVRVCVSTLTSVTTAVSSPAGVFLYVHVCVLIYITRPLASSSFIVKSVLVTVSRCSASQMCQQTAESPASTQLRIPPFWKTLKVMQKVLHKNCIKTIKPSHTEAFRVGNV